ncbi:hypothetical protein BJ085DRAFT_14154 [Dimargaris cristalligena]|uniref:Methionine synthase reductase n=1 Tax=Dimargaris cristalligena TaxID=215637 RepID=A0A4V1J4Q7_9FUNG|nr:hypothetical protein BJ085DRAFT_14154 [Dimargaris cristalligena]|eukprot:RKP36399.1 hypothetical protein BJ085DRAFT_14154 [Dimargaris cristalligena]
MATSTTGPRATDVVFMYGSQTGNAESIALNLLDQAQQRGYQAQALVMDDYEKVAFHPQSVYVFVVSTTGDGDPPDNATKFWRYLRRIAKKQSENWSFMRYTLLGLGDTNYDNFCNGGKRLDEKLRELQAKPFYPRALADDATGLEETVEPWCAGLWAPLAEVCQTKSGGKVLPGTSKGSTAETVVPVPTPTTTTITTTTSSSSSDVPRITQAQYLTAPDALKTTLALTFQPLPAAGKSADFWPGDAFGVICPNPTPLVGALLVRLGLADTADTPLTIAPVAETTPIPTYLSHLGPVSPRTIFTDLLDLVAVPKKAFIRMLADYTADAEEKKQLLYLCSKQGATLFSTFRDLRPTLLDILTTFPSCQPPLERLLDTLPPHQPRYYSVANAPPPPPPSLSTSEGDEASHSTFDLRFVFNVVQYDQPAPLVVKREGLCTPWLERLSLGRPFPTPTAPLHLFLKPNHHGFQLTRDPTRPIVMIGPGTGVAPFMGFLEQLARSTPASASRETWLFYGCRDPRKDYLFRDQLEGYERDGVLSRLVVAYSRYSPSSPPTPATEGAEHPRYVQHHLRRHAADIYRLIVHDNAIIYVCGDALNMARDVNETLAEILVQAEKNEDDPHFGITLMDAKKLLVQWMQEHRYLRDLVSQ